MSRREEGLEQYLEVLLIEQLQMTIVYFLASLAVFCRSGRTVSSSGYYCLPRSIVPYAVNVGGELFQKPWRSQAELHLPGPPGTEMSCTVTALGLVSFRIWWRSMLYRSAVDDVLQVGLAVDWRERDWSVVCRLVTVCLFFFTEDGDHPRFFEVTEMAHAQHPAIVGRLVLGLERVPLHLSASSV